MSVYKEGGNELLFGVDIVFVYREAEVNHFQSCYSVLLQGGGNEGFFRVVIESVMIVEMELILSELRENE